MGLGYVWSTATCVAATWAPLSGLISLSRFIPELWSRSSLIFRGVFYKTGKSIFCLISPF